MSLRLVEQLSRSMKSPTFQKARGLFTDRRGEIKFEHTGRGSYYEAGTRPLSGGTIYIDPLHVTHLSEKYGDYVLTLQGVLVHEMGHSLYALQDRARYPGRDAPVNILAEHCVMAEARATVFAYQVAKEVKSSGGRAIVVAPGDRPNTYDVMAKADLSHSDLLDVAKTIYAADPTYSMYCRGEVTWTGFAVQNLPAVRIIGRRPRR